jgi:hypothetical protein
MSKENVLNCWEYWDCDLAVRQECPAYTQNMGQKCWLAAGTFARNPQCPKLKNKFEKCNECPWFKKLNPDIAV